MSATPIVYCLTRDRALASALDERLAGAIAFFYNDAARLQQAITLRTPGVVVIDTGAVRAEYGDAGLGPIVEFIRRRAPDCRVAVRPAPGVEHLVAAEAGPGVEVLAHDLDACVEGLASVAGIG